MPAKICLYTERLDPPYDEGYKKFAYNLFRWAPEGREVLRLSAGDPSIVDTQIKPDKLLRNGELKAAIGRFRPDAIVYLPSGSTTSASFLRSRIIKSYGSGAPTAIIGLQPRTHSWACRPLIRLLAPDAVYVQSKSTAESLRDLGIEARVVSAGVDTDRFRPVGSDGKAALRLRYGIHDNAFVVLHVGHINEQRNVGLLAEMQALDGVQAVLVGSTSTVQDHSLARSLADKGILILDNYVERIEEVYQLADAYVFPVVEPTAAIEMPLSVLEAMACNLPVISTKFGGLVDCFNNGDGVYFVDDPRELTGKLAAVRSSTRVRTADSIRDYTWTGVINRLLDEIGQLALP